MTLEEVKKIFRYGWIAKDEDENWSWFSEKPEIYYGDVIDSHYWHAEYNIGLGTIEGTEDINYLDSLIEIKGE